ncbi:YhcH/YjgK/YiaL family protein [Pseudoflavonifractor capillosus]|uniref:YhcH/YjgK/YiaL family protein n=1 Tax=Pseudoflavonifractor capillosus TaxID=106588 RepID=UPI00195E0D0A|nr:YhcH/YjgK/YiaL family protein [Pseudoflavonifractor capillosus]MBM6681102.1 YhcH/YjgK/YiaL family protein [Pseudoflavonifractor capillosus]
MIYAKNADALAYRGIHPNLDLALEHITPEFLASLRDNQRVELKGDLVYCTRFTYETIPQEESFFEAHRRYLDIHIMVEGEERVDMNRPEDLNLTDAQEGNDFYAYQGESWHSTVLKPGEFLVVFPGDAHRIKVQVDGPKTVSKAVFKVCIDA